MEYLCEDIYMEILLRLPVKATARFRCVCMSWNKLLSADDFVKVKLDHDINNEKYRIIINTNYCDTHVYSIDNSSLSSKALESPLKIRSPLCDKIYVLGACNGLVCASYAYGLYIWNPCTKEYKIILTMRQMYDFHWDLGRTGYGFCYDSKTQDYKVIVFSNDYWKRRVSEVLVYTLGSNEWKTLPPIPFCIHNVDQNIRGSPGVFLNGSLHWLVDSFPEKRNGRSSKVLLSFDIEDEIFQEISQPDDENWDTFDYKFVGVVGGCLCMLYSACKIGLEVWVMNDYGVKASWAKWFHIDEGMSRPFNYLRSIVDLENNEILLDDEKSNGFTLYDTRSKTTRFQQIRLPEKKHQKPEHNERDIYVYVESLVSVHSGRR